MSIDFYWRLPSHGCHGSLRDTAYDRGDWSPISARNVAPGLDRRGEDDGFRYVDHLSAIAKAAVARRSSEACDTLRRHIDRTGTNLKRALAAALNDPSQAGGD